MKEGFSKGLSIVSPQECYDKDIAHDPARYLFGLGYNQIPSGRVTAVIALEVHLHDGKLKILGTRPRLYIGQNYYIPRDREGELSIDGLNSLGIPISEDNPFVLADLALEPWIDPQRSDKEPVGGYVVIDSVKRAWELNLTDVAYGLVEDLMNTRETYSEEIGLVRDVLDPEAYNTHRTNVIASYINDKPIVVFDQVSHYEGPLEWYIRPVHVMVMAFEVTMKGEVTKSTILPPHVCSGTWQNLRLTLFITKGEVRVGEELLFRLALENEGKETYRVEAGPPFFDLNIYDAEGDLLGSWSLGKGFPEYVEIIELGPGEIMRHNLQWDLLIHDTNTGTTIEFPSGNYQIAGVWVPEKFETPTIGMRMDSSRPALSLTWIKSGGVAGVEERLQITEEGVTTFTDLKTNSGASSIITPADHWMLYELLSIRYLKSMQSKDFTAKSGAADFFSYILTVILDGVEVEVK